jgi:hypothetical protein
VIDHRAEPFNTFFIGLSHIGSFGIVWLTLAVLAVFVLRRPLVFPMVVIAYFATAAAFGRHQARGRPRAPRRPSARARNEV